jgi:NADH:ubiquinone oxidoreductase subunit F (NADH-binding)
MIPPHANRSHILTLLEERGDASHENVRAVARETGVPEADIWGVASFYHLVRNVPRRVCTGLSCQISGADEVLERLRSEAAQAGEQLPEPVSCLGQCDRPVAQIDEHHEPIGPHVKSHVSPDNLELPLNLGGIDDCEYAALSKVRSLGVEFVMTQLTTSGLQGRGGAGFPAHIKWFAVKESDSQTKYVVCNADEAEPGTFKDREVMLRRPHLLLEGLAIAALTVGAMEIHIYVRGAFGACRRSLEKALLEAGDKLSGFSFVFTSGHGAYICGEETALLESIEGKRGMPRLKPPFPTDFGLYGQPTLIHNVESLASIPSIVVRGGEWFKGKGKTGAGSKLYCISGHIKRPGVYELPMGATLTELIEAAGGAIGKLIAFSPGGASSGFLPISFQETPMDFKSLADAGSMLGSAGVVVLNDTVDIARVTLRQLEFFEAESCGQCAPCRLGSRVLSQAVARYIETNSSAELAHVAEVAWEMEEGSICGLGIAAPLPLTSALKHFPEAFSGSDMAFNK